MDIFEQDKRYIANTYARFPINIVSGKGSVCRDHAGKEYIDCGSGIAVNTFGFSDGEWVDAVTNQLNKFQHTSNLYYHQPCVTLAKILTERTGLKKVFFSNSGAEANECAIKVVRKYAFERKGKDYFKILTLNNSFHGRTITTLSATGQEVFHKDFLPLTDGFIHTDANDIDALKSVVEQNKLAGIILEFVQGEGGVNPLTQEFVDEIFALAKKHDILVVADEVQTGNGRTGSLYAFEHYGVMPDVVTTAKGLAGGLPLGATIIGEKAKDALTLGSHGSTFGANPVICAGAINIINRIDQKLLDEVKLKSEYIIGALAGQKGILGVSGLGLMLGVETQKPARQVVEECIERGVIFLTAKNKVRLLPALNIPMDLLKKAIATLIEVCAKD